MPNDVLHGEQLSAWLDAVASHELPAIICVEKAKQKAPVADIPPANRRISLLSIEQNAWVLAGKDDRCVVVDSRTELDWAMKQGQLSVWAPSRVVLDAVNGPQGSDPADLAIWFAQEFSAQSAVILESIQRVPGGSDFRLAATPGDL